MKKCVFAFIILSFILTGCEKGNTDIKEIPQELASEQGEFTQSPEQDMKSFEERVIEEQTFEIDLDDWGQVTFTSIAPQDDSNQPEFVLMKNKQIIYEFPGVEVSNSDVFKQISGVKFTDMNMDGKKDILVLIQYSAEENLWNIQTI